MKTRSSAWCAVVLGLGAVVGCGDDGGTGGGTGGGGPSTSAGDGGATSSTTTTTTTSGDGGSAPVGPGPGGSGGGGGEPATCTDGVAGEDETDVDCGGSCPPCGNGLGCATGDDCISAVCGPGGTCVAPSCGDGVTNGADECDGGGVDDASCDADCTIAQCGDAYANLEAGETCDEGAPSATCDADCSLVACGDGVVNVPAGEACDGGGVDIATCDVDCSAPSCGDGHANAAAGEDCDSFGVDAVACDDDCSSVVCSDGHQNAAAGEQCDDGNLTPGDGCSPDCAIETPADCDAVQAITPQAASGAYAIDPDGAGGPVVPFSAYCEMGIDEGGWTLVMNVNTANGQFSTLAAPIWTATTEVAPFGARWTSDYKSLAAEVVGAQQLLVVVRDANAPEGAAPRGWRSWNLDGTRTWNSFFAVAMGDASANATGGCNSGHSGDGRRQTTGIRSAGVAAPYDTFTGFAADIYTNSYYGACAPTQDGFRLSSWYRWSNNSNVGLGLQMDNDSNGAYSLEAGSHMRIDTYPNPQRFCTSTDCNTCGVFADGGVGTSGATRAAIGTDHYDYHCTVGESYRYEWYVR